jgi:hypothetical protein
MATTSTLRSLASGAIGALAVTALNEGARRRIRHAPRMDVIGMRALASVMRKVGRRPPRGRALFRQTLAGDLISNTLYYALVGAGSRQTRLSRGIALGAAAGLGAALLPPLLGLGRQPGERRPRTPLLTVAWYTAGGIAAAVAGRLLDPPHQA